MKIGPLLKNLWRTETREPVRGFLKQNQIIPSIPVEPIIQGKHYIRFYLRRLYLPYRRIATSTYHAALVAEMELIHEEVGQAEFKKVVAPPELADIPKHQQANLKIDTKELAGPVPYRGEKISLTAGLLAVQSQELAGPFLTTLESLASAAGANYIAIAKPFMEPLGKGMALLAEASGNRGLKIGVTLDLPQPKSGVYVMVDIDREEISIDDLEVTDDYTLSHPKVDLRQHAHFILSLEISSRRDDYLNIPDIKEAYNKLVKALESDKPIDIQEKLIALRRVLAFHPDLLEEHADRLYEKIAARIHRALAPSATNRTGVVKLESLSKFDPFTNGEE